MTPPLGWTTFLWDVEILGDMLIYLVLWDLYFARDSASNVFKRHHAFQQNHQFITSALIGKFCIEKHIITLTHDRCDSFPQFSINNFPKKLKN
jgi:hypothetical protein